MSVIIPAHQEAETIGPCLRAILGQSLVAAGRGRVEVIVAANACSDATVARAQALVPAALARGVDLVVLEDPVGGKTRALNRADARARGPIRVYLDADVRCAPELLAELAASLAGEAPLYASGTVTIPPTRSRTSRAYARFWRLLPFVASGVAGIGLYAVNAAGRRRWGAFPAVHSDDKYVRLLFAPAERRRVAAAYSWPVPDGLRNLLKVRRRWCEGNAELRGAFPELHAARRWGSLPGSLPGALWPYARLAAAAPVSAAVFTIIYAGGLLLALGRRPAGPVPWCRGR